jgi:2-hydroxychromene-2-carboxylate isomerase
MAARDLRFYIDYKSPYAYLSIAPARALEREFGVKFEWLPYVLHIPDFLGTVEGRNDHQWRRVRYSYMDARRFANKQGLILKGPTRIFYARPANAGMLYGQKHGVFRAYNDLAFERFWRRELDPENVDAVSALLAEAGAPPGFAAFLGGEGGAEHDRLRSEAEAAGVFGVPTFVFDGELFWGGDRIGLLRERLDEKGVKRRLAGD